MPRARDAGGRPARVAVADRAAAGESAATPGPELRERVADYLEAFAEELPAPAAKHAAALYEEWGELALALGHSALREPGAAVRILSSPAGAGEQEPSASVATWLELLALGRRLHLEGEAVGASRLGLLGQHPPSRRVLDRLATWLGDFAERARDGEDGPVRELGALHETLLALTFRRLRRPARRLRRSRDWLCPAEVLGWPPNVRSKRLQRQLGLSKHSVHAFGPSLTLAHGVAEVEACLTSLFDPRVPPRAAGSCVLGTSGVRRSSGAHYTPWPLCLELVERALAPLLGALPAPRSQSLLALRVCDPALGAGAFLLAAARFLGDALSAARRDEGAPLASVTAARREVARSVLHGVDKNATAVGVARACLALFVDDRALLAELGTRLQAGDALTGALAEATAPAPKAARFPGALDWRAAFSEVFQRENPGFDAILGNPPWVAYVGRAAQPLPPELAAHYAATNPAFKRYRTLHGLFVYRAAALLRHGGRLGLVLPTSVADLAGYSPTRDAHDVLCAVDDELPDWGDAAFDGVFQPCMALLSTRAPSPPAPPRPVWPLKNDLLGATERRLLERLARLERLPRELFGERGFQTTEDDQAHLLRSTGPRPAGAVPLREGADISEFRALAPQLYAFPERLGTRLKPAAEWREVKLLIRQTARFPLVALSDGHAFRNSILAGFDNAEYPAPLLLALLNSNLYRWLHFTLQRDARQGMPQLKVGHLRALPCLPAEAGSVRVELVALGRRLGEVNRGVSAAQREALETLVGAAFELEAAERAAIAAWALGNPPPVSRRQPPAEHAPRPADLSAHDF